MRAASLFAAFITGTIFTSLIVGAWTGPTEPAPGGNIAPPLNAGNVAQVKNAGLGVNSLAVFGNAIVSGVDRYLNFGPPTTPPGETGYGIRDNAGTMEFKNSGAASWSSIATIVANTVTTAIQNFFASGSTNTVNQIKFADGTTQTTAASANSAEGGPGCLTIGTVTEPGTGGQGSACADGSYFIGRYAGANYFATASDDSVGTAVSSAPALCTNLNRHSHTDWYLPDIQALYMMYENRTQIGGFSSAWYWSKSAYEGQGGWGLNFTNGYQNWSTLSSARVRCIRRA